MITEQQKIISKAIQQGIKLGIELYDTDFYDIDLQSDMQNNGTPQFVDTVIQRLHREVIEIMKPETHPLKNLHDFLALKVLCDMKNKNVYLKVFHIDKDFSLLRLIRKLLIFFGNSINLNWIDVSNVTNMNYLFSNSQFNGDVSLWDVSNVCDMSGMFEYSQFNGDISQWDVSNVRSMYEMFAGTVFTGDISMWDVSSAENMDGMFYDSIFNGDLSKWDVSNVRDMSNMFKASKFNGDLKEWNVEKVWTMKCMFAESLFNKDISDWNIKNVLYMQGMFYASDFNQDISNWNISHVEDCGFMFEQCNIDEANKPKNYIKIYNE